MCRVRAWAWMKTRFLSSSDREGPDGGKIPGLGTRGRWRSWFLPNWRGSIPRGPCGGALRVFPGKRLPPLTTPLRDEAQPGSGRVCQYRLFQGIPRLCRYSFQGAGSAGRRGPGTLAYGNLKARRRRPARDQGFRRCRGNRPQPRLSCGHHVQNQDRGPGSIPCSRIPFRLGSRSD